MSIFNWNNADKVSHVGTAGLFTTFFALFTPLRAYLLPYELVIVSAIMALDVYKMGRIARKNWMNAQKWGSLTQTIIEGALASGVVLAVGVGMLMALAVITALAPFIFTGIMLTRMLMSAIEAKGEYELAKEGEELAKDLDENNFEIKKEQIKDYLKKSSWSASWEWVKKKTEGTILAPVPEFFESMIISMDQWRDRAWQSWKEGGFFSNSNVYQPLSTTNENNLSTEESLTTEERLKNFIDSSEGINAQDKASKVKQALEAKSEHHLFEGRMKSWHTFVFAGLSVATLVLFPIIQVASAVTSVLGPVMTGILGVFTATTLYSALQKEEELQPWEKIMLENENNNSSICSSAETIINSKTQSRQRTNMHVFNDVNSNDSSKEAGILIENNHPQKRVWEKEKINLQGNQVARRHSFNGFLVTSGVNQKRNDIQDTRQNKRSFNM